MSSQDCALAPMIFGIFFAVMLKHAFGTSTQGVYLHSSSDGKLFSLCRLKARTKVRKVLIRDMLFADYAALVAHKELVTHLQRLVDRFARVYQVFIMTV